MTQSRRMSLIEATTNVAVGYILAIVTQIVVFPWFGLNANLTQHLTIGAAFLGVSLVRGYLLRRLFEGIVGREPASDTSAHEKWARRAR